MVLQPKESFYPREVYTPHFEIGEENMEAGTLERKQVQGVYSACEVGRIPNSESEGTVGDNYFVSGSHDMYCVFDGVGSARDAQAAHLAAQEMQKAVEHYTGELKKDVSALSSQEMHDFLLKIIYRVQRTLKEMNEGASVAESYLTTMTLAAVQKGHCFIISVGDSPAFLKREGNDIEEVTVPHDSVREHFETTQDFPYIIDGNVEKEKIDALRQAQAHKSPLLQNRVTHILGEQGPDIGFPFDIHQISLGEHDRLLLCSDGITKELDNDQIAKTLDSKTGLKRAASRLMFQSQRHDNDEDYHDDRVALVIERSA